jgi:aryl-alcohol dehydrogenase-like predicted oxidoreductase
MEHRSLGRTGMQVSPLCLGAMMFGAWGEPDHDTSIKIIHRALDAGINFIDTSDVYSHGESEVIVITLSTDVLDQIDEIVPPGITLAHADTGYLPPALQDPSLRRRYTS